MRPRALAFVLSVPVFLCASNAFAQAKSSPKARPAVQPQGTSVDAICRALAKGRMKDEFETIEAFRERQGRMLAPFIGRRFTFEVHPSSIATKYDAENRELWVTIRSFDAEDEVLGGAVSQGFLIRKIFTNVGGYDASNAMNAKTRVSVAIEQRHFVAVPRWASRDYAFGITVGPEEARALANGGMRVEVAGEVRPLGDHATGDRAPEFPLLERSLTTEPTFTEPLKLTSAKTFLLMKGLTLSVYGKASGKRFEWVEFAEQTGPAPTPDPAAPRPGAIRIDY